MATNFSDWADVRQLVMEKLSNRIQRLLSHRQNLLQGYLPFGHKDDKAVSQEEQQKAREKAIQDGLEEGRREVNVLARKLVEATEGNVSFDTAAGALTDFCKH